MAQDIPFVSYDNRSVFPVVEKRAYSLPVRLAPNTTFARGQVLGATTASTANDVQTFTATGTPTGGSFNWTVTNPLTNKTATLTIPYNCTASALQTLANAIYGSANITAGGGAWPGTPLTLTAKGSLVAVPVPIAVAGTNAFTGGSTPTSTVAHTTVGTTKGTYGVYADGNSDGTQTAECILPRAVQTDYTGNIVETATAGVYNGEFGQTRQVIEAWFGGVFAVADLTGLDAAGVADLGGVYQKNGTLVSF